MKYLILSLSVIIGIANFFGKKAWAESSNLGPELYSFSIESIGTGMNSQLDAQQDATDGLNALIADEQALCSLAGGIGSTVTDNQFVLESNVILPLVRVRVTANFHCLGTPGILPTPILPTTPMGGP